MNLPERLLEIFVLPGCFGSETAIRLGKRVQLMRLRQIEVRLVDLSVPGIVRPAQVFAVPTYLLDGRLLCLGNPEEEWLISRLTASARPGPGGP